MYRVAIVAEHLVAGGISRYCIDLLDQLRRHPDVHPYLVTFRRDLDEFALHAFIDDLSQRCRDRGIEMLVEIGQGARLARSYSSMSPAPAVKRTGSWPSGASSRRVSRSR